MTQPPATKALGTDSASSRFRLQEPRLDGLSRGMKHQLMSLTQAAEALNVSVDTVRRMIHRREIPFVKVGSQYRISEGALDRWIESRTVLPAAVSEQVA